MEISSTPEVWNQLVFEAQTLAYAENEATVGSAQERWVGELSRAKYGMIAPPEKDEIQKHYEEVSTLVDTTELRKIFFLRNLNFMESIFQNSFLPLLQRINSTLQEAEAAIRF